LPAATDLKIAAVLNKAYESVSSPKPLRNSANGILKPLNTNNLTDAEGNIIKNEVGVGSGGCGGWEDGLPA
jgi:hypothetical protein